MHMDSAERLEQQYEQNYPWISWRDPQLIVTGNGQGLACRYCVALHGLRGSEVGNLPQTYEEFERHMADFHPEKPPPERSTT